MQKRTYEQHTPLAMAHLMGRRTESQDEGPIRFRVQADRRKVEAIAQGAADRRVRRAAAASTDRIADTIDDAASSAASDIVPTK